MHTFILSAVLLVWILAKSTVDGALSITNSGSDEEDSATYSLKCEISVFSAQATWSRNSVLMTTCFSSVCLTTSNPPYTFRYDASGIYVDFSTLAESEDDITWTCEHTGDTPVNFTVQIDFRPTLQTSTILAIERTTSVNNIYDNNNGTIPITTESITSTRYLSSLTISYLNTDTTDRYVNRDFSNSYTYTLTTNTYANTETAIFNANTNPYVESETANFNASIETTTSGIISNALSTYQSVFVTKSGNNILGSVFPDITSQNMTAMFASLGSTITSNDEITLPSSFETNQFFSQTFLETSFSFSLDTERDNSFHTLYVSSNSSSSATETSYITFEITNAYLNSSFSMITETLQTLEIPLVVISSGISTVWNSERSESLLLSLSVKKSNLQQMRTSTETSWISSKSVVDASDFEDSSFSSYQILSETILTFPNYSVNSQMTSLINDATNHFTNTKNILITSYLDNTSFSLNDLEVVFSTFSNDNAASALMSFDSFFHSTGHNLTLQTTEFHTKIQAESTSYHESNIDNGATEIHYTEKNISKKSSMHTSIMPSKLQLGSMNDIQGSASDFQSTYYDLSYLPTDVVFASEMSEEILSSLRSTSLSLSFNTKDIATGNDTKTTNVLTITTLSSLPTNDMSRVQHLTSIQSSAVLSALKPTWLTTATNFNDITIPSLIKPSSQHTYIDNSYIPIETSFRNSLISLSSSLKSLTSKDQDMTTLSSGVYQTISPSSTSTRKSGLSEKNKTVIFISTTSAIVIAISVILLIIFGKIYMSKNKVKICKEDDYISWSNPSCSPKTSFPEYSFIGRNIHPILNTASYTKNWNGIV